MRLQLRIDAVIVMAVLALSQAGCVKHARIAGGTPVVTRHTPAPSPSKPVRTVLEISRQNSTASEEKLAKLRQENPELARMSKDVADAGAVASMRSLAEAYLKEGAYVQAFDLFEQLRLKAPGDPAAEIGLAEIWDQWRDYSLAQQHADRAVILAPFSVRALEIQGRISLHRNDFDAAIASFEAALQEEPRNAPVLANAGYAYMLRSEWDKAKARLAKSVEIDGSVPEVRNNLGITLAFLGALDQARNEFLAVNRPAAAFNNLGVALMSQNQWEAAKEELEHALLLEPTYEKARQNLSEVMAHLPPPAVSPMKPSVSESPGDAGLHPQAAPISTLDAIRETKSDLSSPTEYVIQVYSDTSLQRAESQRKCLANKGLALEVDQVEVQGRGRFYRVRLHGFKTLKAAQEKAREMLQEGLIGDYWILPDSPKG